MGLKSKNGNVHEQLIEGCRNSDSRSQFEIYKLYYKAMYNTALRITGEQQTSEDIMQEAFLDAFQKIQQYDEKATFGAWLKRIVINKSINQLIIIINKKMIYP